ncbi:hypothetical protein CHUV2995_01102 [Corynebacterium diphtheriae subsp. lausannense]|uniref:hypothetical protein n=1 Tax=Corynebacterium belfantii TaxID=2014537 RepID=UPI000DC1F3C0|nr:hypothetical protein CHUV2995_01102 [Corynebacterium diphtheriae subsp. lausannense]
MSSHHHHSSDRTLDALRAINPVADDTLSREETLRRDASLAAILDQATVTPLRRRRVSAPMQWAAIAASVALLAGGGLTLPNVLDTNPAVATAEEVLTTTADRAGHKAQVSDIAATTSDFLRRSDTDGTGTVTVAYEVHDGAVTHSVDTDGELSPELAQRAQTPEPKISPVQLNTATDMAAFIRDHAASIGEGSEAKTALHLLLVPGASPAAQKQLYAFLAQLSGNELAHAQQAQNNGDDEIVSVIRDKDQLSFDILPATGQLVRVVGLIPSVTTSIDAAGIVDCVRLNGTQGPELLSLACGDNNHVISDLTWGKWGDEAAHAHGKAWLNACDPNCAQGQWKTYPVKVTATNKRTCGYNLEVYTKIDVEYDSDEQAPAGVPLKETYEPVCVP